MTRALFGPLRRVHWSAVGAALVTAAGAMTSAGFVAALPPRYAHVGPYLTALGLVLQAYTKPVARPKPSEGEA